MQWFLRDGPRELVLSTEDEATPSSSMPIREAAAVAEVLRSLSEDPASMTVLREIHEELVEGRTVREHEDALLVEDLRAEVARRRLFVFEQDHSAELRLYEPVEMAEVAWEESERLVVREESEAVVVEEEVSAVVLAQVEALVQASAEGVAFCEICRR